MKKFTLLLFLSVLFTGLTFAQESLFKTKGKHQAKETNNPLKEKSSNKINLERLNKSEKSSSFYEGFENWNPNNPSQLPNGWTQFRTSSLTATPTTEPESQPWVANNIDSDPFGEETPEEYIKIGNGSMIIGFSAGNNSPNGPFTWAVSPEFTLQGSAGDLAFLSYWKWYEHLAEENWFTNYHINIFADGAWTTVRSFIGSENPTANKFDELVGIDLSEYIGKTIKVAFVYEYTDGYQMAIDEIDVSVVPNYDNGITTLEYQWYQWWPILVGKEMFFDVEVVSYGVAPGVGKISMFVNDLEIDTDTLEFMLYSMSDVAEFSWIPDGPGSHTIRFQLSDELDDGDGNMVADENPANNILELTFDIPDPETILFTEGFENVDWEHPDGATVIFPPSNDWLVTDAWGATTSRAMTDLVSAAVYQINGDQPETMVTPGMTLPVGDVKIDLIVGGLNNGITDNGVYLGHSTLEVYLLDALPAKEINEETLLITYELDSLVGDDDRQIALYLENEIEGTYYLAFVTTSTFDYVDPDGNVFSSGVFLDNIMVSSVEMVDVTFNLDVTNLDGFDPATHNIYMTGTPTNWSVPGSEYSVTMTRDESVTESIIYTTTISLEDASDVAYRYYSDVIGEGFQGGEWDVNVSREITIDGTMTINDTWASYLDVSVDEVSNMQNLRVYPNPVRENLTIINDQNISSVRIFDITGRVVFNADINDITAEINVSDFNQGVYVVQIISGNEVSSRKINVVK